MITFKSSIIVCSFIISSFLSLNAQKIATNPKAGEIAIVEKDYPGQIDGYSIYLPKSYDKLNKKFAILFFLHGGLGVGGRVEKVNEQPVPQLLLNEQDMSVERNQYLLDSFIVISPHMHRGQFFENEDAIREITQEVLHTMKASRLKIYITGLSRGGYGTWGLADRMHDVFAAAAPIAGDGFGVRNFKNLSKLPIWAIHNTDDNVVSYDGTLNTVKRVEREAGISFYRINTAKVKGKEYLNYTHILSRPTMGDASDYPHDAWTTAYEGAELYKWLLKQHK